MSWLQQIVDGIRNLVQWWFIVLPWERAVRVRFGRRVQSFDAGIHFRAPFVDRVYVQNVRQRIVALYPQTLTTADGKTITCTGSVRYCIEDLLKLYRTLHQPDATIRQHVEGLLAEFVVTRELHACTPEDISEHVTERMDLAEFGLSKGRFFLTEFAVVKTYRLIGGDMQRWVGSASELNTELPIGVSQR